MFFSKRRSPWVLNGGRERPFKKIKHLGGHNIFTTPQAMFFGGGVPQKILPYNEYYLSWHPGHS